MFVNVRKDSSKNISLNCIFIVEVVKIAVLREVEHGEILGIELVRDLSKHLPRTKEIRLVVHLIVQTHEWIVQGLSLVYLIWESFVIKVF